MEGNQVYAIYRQVHPPTGIEHCLYCNFIDGHEKNLVVAGVNVLQVYRLTLDSESSQQQTSTKSHDKGADKTADVLRSKRMRLECVTSFQLFGNIMSMQSVRLAGATQDSLLLSFADAKLSMVEFDTSTHSLKTSSLHYFEEDDLKDGHCQQCINVPTIRVDTEGRCAAMLIYGRHLVILPFRHDLVVETSDSTVNSHLPVLSSYTIDLRKLDEKINNVLDFQFLHGYYEPTVVLLYEPLPTWAGRIAVRRDTCCIVAISLNLEQHVHPVIWSMFNLPMDCCQIYAVPKPIGGVLVFAVNSLLYLNQSQPPYGVSLNSITNISTDFLLKTQEGVKISLDCAQATFVSTDKLVVSLRGGELYVLTLLVDAMRVVRSFHLDKAAASVLTTSMCVCGDGFLFLGSRLGNSLLLRYTEKQLERLADGSSDITDEPAAKKRKECGLEWTVFDAVSADDLEDLEVYGSNSVDDQTGSQLTQYMFEVCDSIMNVGPCGQVVMGEPAFLSEEFHGADDCDLELVTTSGYGKNGALSVLQRSIRPQVVTTFELPGCTDMWTVVGDERTEDESEQENTEDGEETHTFLILSREDSSMVLKTGQEIMELDQSGLYTQAPTVFAGNIGNNKYVVQVCAQAVRLLEGVKELQHIPLAVGSPIVSCSLADPHIILMTEEGHLMLLLLKQSLTGEGARLVIIQPEYEPEPRITTMCAFRDLTGSFSLIAHKPSTATVSEPTIEQQQQQQQQQQHQPLFLANISATIEDEDELLYGESSESHVDSHAKDTQPSPQTSSEQEREPTYWVALCRENGLFEICSLPEFKVCFCASNFPSAPRVLCDAETGPSSSGEKPLPPQHEQLIVKELLLVCLGGTNARPFLMARVNDDLLIYESFAYLSQPDNENRLKLRFKKASHGLIISHKKPASTTAAAAATAAGKTKSGPEIIDITDDDIRRDRVPWLRPFDDISGYSGVFVCGPYPQWILMTPRGILRIHPMNIDGSVTCFTPFHNVNCPKGFLYFNKQGELRICVLPTHLSYDAPWPVRKVPLRCTPYFVAYHPDSKTYGVVTSIPDVCNKFVRLVGDGDKEFETVERDERFVYPNLEKFNVQLFSPVTWEPIPNTKYELEEFERVTCMQCVNLKSEGTVTGFKPYVALGTNYAYSEDVTCRGRIIVYDVIEVVPEPGQPLTKNKLKIEYDKEQRGAITALDAVHGFLVTAIGQKIYIWQLKDDDLSGVAFIDTQVYVQSLATIKNLILVGDIYKSITLLRYQEDMKVLSLVSRDMRPVEVYSVAFLIDNTNLDFVVSDRQKNLLLYSYMPLERDSHGGQILLRRNAINIGSHINSMFRVQCKTRDIDKRITGRVERRQVTYFATLDGSIGFVLPVTEKVYRRLSMLQNLLNTHIPHLAGLNPKSYRTVEHEGHELARPIKNILDAELIWKFLDLTMTERADIARRLVTTVDQIIADLMEIERSTAHF